MTRISDEDEIEAVMVQQVGIENAITDRGQNRCILFAEKVKLNREKGLRKRALRLNVGKGGRVERKRGLWLKWARAASGTSGLSAMRLV